MLRHPYLAKCTDRNSLPKSNPRIGGPEQWLNQTLLNALGYVGLSFDFFIDWNTDSCKDELWIKRISDTDINTLAGMGIPHITQQLINIGDMLDAEYSFSRRYNFTTSYQIFRDNVSWRVSPEPILKAELGATGVSRIVVQTLPDVMASIRALSGGPVRIGTKGLIFGTSSLECFLSGTDSLWPGDVDCVLWHPATQRVIAVLEYKKHTLDTPVNQQQLSNYYPYPDGRKYKRLAIFRERLGVDIPLITIYYPTNTNLDEIKLELIGGHNTALKTINSSLINYRGKTIEQLGREVVNKVLELP